MLAWDRPGITVSSRKPPRPSLLRGTLAARWARQGPGPGRSMLSGTMLETLIPRIPDDWTAWTFADSHGVVTGLRDALLEAGLIDPGLGWIAPPRTALIGCGD